MSEQTKGIFLLPDQYERSYGALLNQQDYMRRNPGVSTLVAEPVKPETLCHLRYAQANPSRIPEFRIDIPTGWHIAEGSYRLSTVAEPIFRFSNFEEYQQQLHAYMLTAPRAKRLYAAILRACAEAEGGFVAA